MILGSFLGYVDPVASAHANAAGLEVESRNESQCAITGAAKHQGKRIN